MENKIGEIESFISLEEYKKAVKCRYKTGDKFAVTMGLLFLICGIIMPTSANDYFWLIIKVFFIFFGSLILYAFLRQGKTIKSNYKLLEENGENTNRYEFYDDYIFRSNVNSTSKVTYDKFIDCVEDDEYIVCFTELNRFMMFKKYDCSEEILEKLRSIMTEEKKLKKKRRKRKGNISFVAIIIYIILSTSAAFYFNNYNNKPDYPYATYESFIKCAEGGYVDNVVIYKNKLSFAYTGYDEDKYYYVEIKGNKDEVIEQLNKLDINWSYE